MLLADSIVENDYTGQYIMECVVKINDMEVMSFKNMLTLDPWPEKDVPLQPAYSESGEIKGGNNIVEGCQRECEYESSSNIETEFWGSEAGSDSSFINSTVKLLLLAVCEQYCGKNSRSSLHKYCAKQYS